MCRASSANTKDECDGDGEPDDGSRRHRPGTRRAASSRSGRSARPTIRQAEFRFGDRMWQWGLWWRYMEEMGTNDLNYTIGQSTPANNWYYAQSLVRRRRRHVFRPEVEHQLHSSGSFA